MWNGAPPGGPCALSIGDAFAPAPENRSRSPGRARRGQRHSSGPRGRPGRPPVSRGLPLGLVQSSRGDGRKSSGPVCSWIPGRRAAHSARPCPGAPRPPRGSRGPASVGSGRPANAVRSRFIHGPDKTCHVLPRGVQGSARSFPQSRTSRPPGWKGGASPALLRFPWRLRCPAKGITWCRVHGRKRQETRRAREFPTVPGPFATCFFT